MKGIKNIFKMSDGVYNFLKWTTLCFIPVSATAYVGLAAIWGFPYAEEISKTAVVICGFLGGLLGISSAQYYKDGGEPFDEDKYWLDDDETGEGVEK